MFNFKGQSAIEYLMTYGWMLLVVAIMGGVIFSFTGDQSVESVNGFSGDSVQVVDFGISNGELDLVLRNTGSSGTIVNLANVSDDQGRYSAWNGSLGLETGETDTITLENVTEGDGFKSLDAVVSYDQRSLTDLEVKGVITGGLELTEESSVKVIENNGDNGEDGEADSSEPVSWSEPHSSSPDCSAVSYNGSGTETDPYNISNDHRLQCMNNDLSANYILTQNINASGTSNWNGGKGLITIGDAVNPFYGSLNGQGFQLEGLTINRPDQRYVGLFGETDTAIIENIGVTDANITGEYAVGGVVGVKSQGKILNSYSTGSITATEDPVEAGGAGGIVGRSSGTILNSHSTASIYGKTASGGLAGRNYYGGNITNSFARGDVAGTENVGGLVGDNYEDGEVTSIEASYSTGDVNGTINVGGFVGRNINADVSTSYWDDEAAIVIEDGVEKEGYSAGAANALVTSQMQGSSAETNMQGFDFTNTWRTIQDPDDYPRLR